MGTCCFREGQVTMVVQVKGPLDPEPGAGRDGGDRWLGEVRCGLCGMMLWQSIEPDWQWVKRAVIQAAGRALTQAGRRRLWHSWLGKRRVD